MNMFRPCCLHKIILNQSENQNNLLRNKMDCQGIINVLVTDFNVTFLLDFGLIDNRTSTSDGYQSVEF